MHTKSIRMTEGNIKSQIIKFAVPLFWGNLFQQLYNVIDAIVVGNYLGDNALAAVSSTGALVFLLVGFFGGIASGIGVVISQFFGAKDEAQVRRAVGTAVSFGLIAGVLLTIFGTVFTPYFLELMGTPQEVFVDAVSYIQTYFAGIIFLILYNTASGIFQAVGDSKRPLYYLIVSSIINVVLDILFITVLDMGVQGVAIATVIAQAVSAFLAFLHLYRVNDVYQVTLKTICIDKPILHEMLRVGIPSGIQNSMTALANVVVQSSINSFGTVAMAGTGAYTKIEKFAFIPITSFSMAITTFVSQNLGAGNSERAKQGAKFGIIFSCGLAQCLGVFFFFFSPQLISVFGDNPDVIASGVQRATISSLFYFLLSFSHSIASVLRGAGRAKVSMFIMLSSWCVIRVAYIKSVTYLFHDIVLVFWAYPLTWFLSSLCFLYYYKKSDWHVSSPSLLSNHKRETPST